MVFSRRWEEFFRSFVRRVGSVGPGVGKAASQPLRDTSNGLEEGVGDEVRLDAELGRAIRWDGDGVGSGDSGPVASPGRVVADLSHMPHLGDLFDAAKRGEVGERELTSALKGLERQYGPYHVRNVGAFFERGSTQFGQTYPATVTMSAEIRDSSGADAGLLMYEFWRDSDGLLVANNEVTVLADGFRGKGFSTAFSSAIENYFRRSGVHRIELQASREDGGYHWAKAGYDWNPDPVMLQRSVNLISNRIDKVIDDGLVPSGNDVARLMEMKSRFDGPVSGYPSPLELALLEGDDPKLGETLMRGSIWFGMKKL
ncbi:hypothetical protein IU486_34430 [Streptomyces gardneri]|uniref:hypothetical protein n=1 Tax=Nocardia sputi TaxID=2943705 RepID=UPI0020C173C2|nr:hypothetical protein [Nocardia sputi]MBF6169772.1 hypothetical protein [Streptomyces gardneri]